MNKSIQHSSSLSLPNPAAASSENVRLLEAKTSAVITRGDCCTNEQDLRRETFVVQKSVKNEMSSVTKEVKNVSTATVTSKGEEHKQQNVVITDKHQQLKKSPKRKAEDNAKSNPIKKLKKIPSK